VILLIYVLYDLHGTLKNTTDIVMVHAQKSMLFS